MTTRHSGFCVLPSLFCLLVSCSQPTPEDAAQARASATERGEAQPDTIAELIQSRVPPAGAGDTGWKYQQRVSADVDGDGADEWVVLIADVGLDVGGIPMWEHGHRWQVYVEEANGERTRLYARFLPNGKLTAELAQPEGGVRPTIVLLEQWPEGIAVYEYRYNRPGQFDVWSRLERRVDRSRTFVGSPRP
jgi:hypothetical protein